MPPPPADNDGSELTEEQLEGDPCIPAYAMMPSQNALSGNAALQPQCSGNADTFCFFCAFEPQVETGGCEHPDSLRSFVRALIDQHVEVPVIVKRLKQAYDESVRQSVTYCNPETGETVVAPEWTLESIHTHLVHSKEFPAIFEDSIEQVFHSLINSQNNSMISSVSRQAKPEVLDAFLKTVRALSQYRESRSRLQGIHGVRTANRAGKNKSSV